MKSRMLPVMAFSFCLLSVNSRMAVAQNLPSGMKI
jgi:hypothetical protein